MIIVIPGIPFPVSTCIHYRDTISPGLKKSCIHTGLDTGCS
ncbi:MAG: hypothetical protein WC593_06400 [Methanoregula sp.]